MGQNEIERYAGAILNDPRFQKLRSFEHHGPANTVYDHSLAVTRAAYRIACALHLSEEETASVVRAALLHDFFGYDWHSERFRRFVRGYLMLVGALTTLYVLVQLLVRLFIEIGKWMPPA